MTGNHVQRCGAVPVLLIAACGCGGVADGAVRDRPDGGASGSCDRGFDATACRESSPVADGQDPDSCTVRTEAWPRTFPGSNGITDVAIDQRDGVWISGYYRHGIDPGGCSGALTGDGTFLARLDANGRTTRVIPIGVDGSSWIASVAVSRSGDVYFTGTFSGHLTIGSQRLEASTTRAEAFVARLTGNGGVLWTKSFASTLGDLGVEARLVDDGLLLFAPFEGDVDFGAAGVVRDPWQTVFRPSERARSFFLSKLGLEGGPVWARRFGGDSGVVPSVVANSHGDAFVSGVFDDSPSVDAGTGDAAAQVRADCASLPQAFLVSVVGDGQCSWVLDDAVSVVAADSGGNVIAGGRRLQGSNPNLSEPFVRSYDASGALSWEAPTGWNAFGVLVSGAVSEQSGKIAVSGSSWDAAGSRQPGSYISALSSGGRFEWSTRVQETDDLAHLRFTSSGELIAAGRMQGTPGSVVVKETTGP